MIELLKQDFPAHYGLHRSKIDVLNERTNSEHFDLTDKGVNMIVAYQNGNVSFNHSSQTEVEVINYELFLNGLHGTSFERGRKRCDFILYEKGGTGNRFFLLNEQTSTSGSTLNLSKPILDKNRNVVFSGGKYEKVEVQLVETLKTLKAVPNIASFISKYQHKICLMSYEILPLKIDNTSSARKAFTVRYKQVESRATGESGAILEHPILNSEGFEYRRISHDYSFQLS